MSAQPAQLKIVLQSGTGAGLTQNRLSARSLKGFVVVFWGALKTQLSHLSSAITAQPAKLTHLSSAISAQPAQLSHLSLASSAQPEKQKNLVRGLAAGVILSKFFII